MNALRRFGSYPLYISTPIAAIVAAVVAGIAHLIIGDVLGGIPDGFRVDTPSGEQDLVFGSSMFAAFLYTIIGGVVYAIVRRFSGNPERLFVIVAVVVTLLSLIQPFTIEDGPGKVIATLVTLHIIAAIVAIPALIGLTRPKTDDRLQEA
jgi:membrane protease YdiL (CAAX protease family)